MYNHFICLTICRYLAKSGYPLTNTITDLTNLPEPCNNIIEQLSTLSLHALKKHNLVFTLDEIKAVCPDIYDCLSENQRSLHFQFWSFNDL